MEWVYVNETTCILHYLNLKKSCNSFKNKHVFHVKIIVKLKLESINQTTV